MKIVQHFIFINTCLASVFKTHSIEMIHLDLSIIQVFVLSYTHSLDLMGVGLGGIFLQSFQRRFKGPLKGVLGVWRFSSKYSSPRTTSIRPSLERENLLPRPDSRRSRTMRRKPEATAPFPVPGTPNPHRTHQDRKLQTERGLDHFTPVFEQGNPAIRRVNPALLSPNPAFKARNNGQCRLDSTVTH